MEGDPRQDAMADMADAKDGEGGSVGASPGAGLEPEPLFVTAESHDLGCHELQVLVPGGEGWLETLAAEYRRLRTTSRVPAQALSFEGVEMLDVTGVEALLAGACVPQYRRGNFGVSRSDLAEVILGLVQAERYSCRYGYRSVRDRELKHLPGRGVDQIGIEGRTDGEAPGLTLVLGEAKVSTDRNCPPRVVDDADDGLRNQHLGHLADKPVTADKVIEASRNADDPEVQAALRIAALLLRSEDERLRIVASSAMVRPEGFSTPEDFGSFHSHAEDFEPADIRFLLVRLPGDIDELVEVFTSLALSGPEAAA